METKRNYEKLSRKNLVRLGKDYDKTHSGMLEKFYLSHSEMYEDRAKHFSLKLRTGGKVNYGAYKQEFEDSKKDLFKSTRGVWRCMRNNTGNRAFQILVPDEYISDYKYYRVYGIWNAVELAHVISMDLNGKDVIIENRLSMPVLKIRCHLNSKAGVDSDDKIYGYKVKVYADKYSRRTVFDTFDDCLQELTAIADDLVVENNDDENALKIDRIISRLKVLLNSKGIEVNASDKEEDK